MSRQCNEPAPGYFFLPLDYYIYEAEHAKPLSGSAHLVRSWLFLGHLRGDACDGGTGAEAEERSPCPWSRRSGVLAGRSFDHPQFILVLHGHDYPVTVALTKGQSQVTGVTYKAVLAASPVLAGLA